MRAPISALEMTDNNRRAGAEASVQKPKRVVEQMFAALDRGDADRAAALYAEDALAVGFGMEVHGRAELGQMLAAFTRAFPDLHHTVKLVIASGKDVVVEAITHGTQKGPLAFPTGEIAATGRTIELPFVNLFRVDRDRIISDRLYLDQLTFLRQLGVM